MSSKSDNALPTAAADDVLARTYPGARGKLKRDILAGALHCFNETGLEPTTIEMIRAYCDTSVGAIYHHFKSKEGLAAALLLAALDDQHALMERQLSAVAAGDAKGRIEAMVSSYMQWVAKQPDLARFIFQARSYVSKGPHGEELAQRNKAHFASTAAWIADGIKQGLLRSLPREAYGALILGPAESYCRGWLAGRLPTSPQRLASEFARAAWLSIGSGS